MLQHFGPQNTMSGQGTLNAATFWPTEYNEWTRNAKCRNILAETDRDP